MTALPTLAWRNREHRAIAERIRRFGVSITMVRSGCAGCDCGPEIRHLCPDDAPPFAYTTGLFGTGHPELLVFLADPVQVGTILNDLSGHVLSGHVLDDGQHLDLAGSGYRGYVEAVPNAGEIVFAANEFYRRPPEASVPVLQVTFSDHTGRMPWEDGYRGEAWLQPRPGEFSA